MLGPGSARWPSLRSQRCGRGCRSVEELSAANERRLLPKRRWTPAKLTPGALERLLGAIVGVEVALDRLDGRWKLSQNKREADRAAVIRGLEDRGDPASAAVAALMRRHGTSR
ncbi:MAG TPA: hypothetical protein VFG47_20095 [Geminicoccaceae bacterium]|nr:hypothetical protein [Geminicoccaceae bacterium]